MSLLDTLIGSTSRGTTQNTADQTQTQDQTKVSSQNTQATTTQNQQQQSSGNTSSNTQQKNNSAATGVTSSLDKGVVDLVSGLISNLAGGKGQTSDIVTALLNKANTPAISDEDIKGQQSAAVTSFNNNEKVSIGRTQDAIGSAGNTYSALLAQKGNTDLAATLAGIVAQAHATNQQISTNQLIAAMQGSSADATSIANLVSSLKGANVTSTQNIAGETAQSTDTVQQILDILNGTNVADQTTTSQEDTSALATGSSSSYTKGKQGSGVLGFLF